MSDQVTVKLNKDLFLVPKRFAGVATVKAPEEEPYFVVTGELPKLIGSEEELAKLESIGSASN